MNATTSHTTDELATRIALWTQQHQLEPHEIERLNNVMIDFEPADWDLELDEELKAVLAARILATRKPLTLEETRTAERNSIASGRTKLIPKD